MSTSTPWGAAQHAERYIRGITWYSTAAHGGFKVCAGLNARIPEYMRDAGGWYEEDCDWSIVATVFPEAFLEREGVEKAVKSLAAARDTLRNWRPEAYEAWYGVTLEPGESHVKDEKTWNAAHAADWVVVSAVRLDGSDDLVRVSAAIGGRSFLHHNWNPPTVDFLVPVAEYHKRGPHGFVVDPSRHVRLPEGGIAA